MAYGTVNVGSAAKPAGDYLTKDDINQPSGVLGLDETGKIPESAFDNAVFDPEDTGLESDTVNGALKEMAGKLGKNHEITLSASGWSAGRQTVGVPGVSADEKDDWISFSPAEDSETAVNEAQLMMESQAQDSVTFVVTTQPSADLHIVVNVQGAVMA